MRTIIFASVVISVLAGGLAQAETVSSLESGWNNPPNSARLRAYWWWLNGNVTQASITHDLEEMKAKGFGGAVIFDANGAAQDGNAPVPHGPTFFTPEWRELYKHTLREANRLGLEISLNIQSGWNLGGPGVTPEDAAKKYVWSELKTSGGTHLTVKLPPPPAREGYYRDTAVIAYRRKDASGNSSTLTASSSLPGHLADLAGDGDDATFWVSGGTKAGEGPSRKHSEWLQVSLEKPAVLSALKILGRPGYGPRNCELQVSADGNHFDAVKAFAVKDGAEAVVKFPPSNARAIRVVFLDAFDPKNPTAPRNVQVAELQLPEVLANLPVSHPPLKNWKQKALQESLKPFSAPDSSPLFAEIPATPGEQDAETADVVDLSGRLSTDGTLNWDAPAGDWQILRFGYTIGDHAYVSTCSDGWNGFAIDVYSATAFQNYWDKIVEPLIADAGPLAGNTLKYLHTDSWEVELANWTPTLRAEFQKRRGYDLTPWLPVLAGRIVNSREASDRFLFDYRQTLGDLAIDGHFRLFRDNAHKHGISIHPESGGPHAVPIDAQRCLGWDDAPMSEFWAWSWTHRIGDTNRFFVKQPASAAHTYGHPYVFAEGFTTIGPHWQEKIWDNLKPCFDKALCEGLNVLVWHAFVCSPVSEGIPGQQYFAGTHLNPKVTWWQKSAPFFSYINRCQWMLQRGHFAADGLYYYGDHVPNFAQLKSSDPAHIEPGYDYDVITAEALIERAAVKDGKIFLPDGINYRVLVLPDRDVISLRVLKKIKSLVAAGATVIGPKPLQGETLQNGKSTDAAVKKLADVLWGGKTGKGRVIAGKTAREVLLTDGVPPDCEFTPANGAFDYIHRTDGKAEIYFVGNRTNIAATATVAFRVTGKAPELWNPVTGERKFATGYEQKDGRTHVPLDFAPCGSWFVIFQAPSAAHPPTAKSNSPELKLTQEIAGAWTVHFDPQWGGPATAQFDSLASWPTRTEPGIKFYSGTAVYEKMFTLPSAIADAKSQILFLDLGDVRELAEVKVNGQACGIVWCPPWRVEVTKAVKPGENKLEIEVVNFWPNRIIGDAGLPESQRLTRTNIRKLTAKTPLEPAGLFGPVTLQTAEIMPAK
ncbi:MAG: glycosyl hydrolase [Verrucomicrobiota bacterium]